MSESTLKEAPKLRPKGAAEIRRAAVRAAGRRFAAEGLDASLRDIAADANINVGLIHRHVGNKDDLIRLVLVEQSRAGARAVARAKDLDEAFGWMFGQLRTGGDYVRIVARLLLSPSGHGNYERDYETIRALRDKMPDGVDELGLIAAMTLVYGWAVFGDQLADAFGVFAADRGRLDAGLGAVAAQLANGPNP
jgi:TetR/AcrR family transcriptional regulator, repressor for neighboring sulfatase